MAKERAILIPTAEMLLATGFWGFGFIAVVWALPSLNPSAIVAYRFLSSFVLGVLFFPFVSWKTVHFWREFKLALGAGLLLGLCIYLQTWGLEFTTATNSGFITSLYVVLVPLVARISLHEHLHPLHWAGVVFALLGTSLIVDFGHAQLNSGDLLTLACAAVAAIQIVFISWASRRSQNAFVLNTLQCFWAGVPFLTAFFWSPEKWSLANLDSKAWIGLCSLAFGSSFLAFFLQIKAQKRMPPSLASLLYLLESPFSCLFAVLLLGEKVSARQIAGALLIFGSCGLAIFAEKKRTSP